MSERGATVTPVDLVVLGGGCAGLSLAARLADLAAPPTVRVLEARTEYANDRTWSFWAPREHEWSDIASHRWDTWRFSTPQTTALHRPTADVSYHALAADRFAEAMRKRIDQHDNVELVLGTTVDSVTRERSAYRVATDGGDLLAHHVVDTRPTPAAPSAYGQRFVGHEVEFSADRFDPAEAGLMLDMQADDLGFRFTYVLPFSERHALIEETRFGRVGSTARLEHDLDVSVEQIADGADVQMLRREGGFLPMTTAAPPAATDGVITAGIRAGAARASTGYAFLRIQRWAHLNAARLAAGDVPISHPAEPTWRRLVDGLFLQVLDQRPELAPEIFSALGERLRPETLARFLSDDARLVDFAHVVQALPKLPFLRELVRSSR
ncbi:MAG: lycopene cyclase family protein [Actinomycetota bacterium]